MIRLFLLMMFLGSALATPLAAQVVMKETPLADEVQEKEARAIMKGLRCLVCQNQSIEDSNADLARDLRIIVREKVAEGMDKPEIEAYLVARYGDWVLMMPPVNDQTMILWLAPLGFVFLGGLVVFVYYRRRSADKGEAPLNADERTRLEDRLGKGDKA